MFKMNKKIFVYGTLMKGGDLNNYLKNCKFLGVGKLNNFAMYSNGYYPMIKRKINSSVFGEIYLVSSEEYKKLIPLLDYIEREYKRIEVFVEFNKKLVKVETYVYNYPTNNLYLIKSGNWKLKGGKNGSK